MKTLHEKITKAFEAFDHIDKRFVDVNLVEHVYLYTFGNKYEDEHDESFFIEFVRSIMLHCCYLSENINKANLTSWLSFLCENEFLHKKKRWIDYKSYIKAIDIWYNPDMVFNIDFDQFLTIFSHGYDCGFNEGQGK